jgi:hypothetical protein
VDSTGQRNMIDLLLIRKGLGWSMRAVGD